MFIFSGDGSGMPTTWPGAIATIVIVVAAVIVIIAFLKHDGSSND